jgi:hypothetical protein
MIAERLTAQLLAGRRRAPRSRSTGYTVLTANSIGEASELAKGCPVLDTGGSVEVYETVEVM